MVTTQVNNEIYQLNESEIIDRINRFPSTRYYGSKKRLLKWIYSNLKGLQFDSAIDAFGGTSCVSLLFKSMGKHVAFNDIFQFNTVSAKVLLSNDKPDNIMKIHEFFDNVKPKKGIVSKHYKDIFYTDDENAWLDGAVVSVNSLNDSLERNFIWYCLFQACLQKRPYNLFHRANLYMRLHKNIKRGFGNLTTWNTSFKQLAKAVAIELYACLWNSGIEHEVFMPQDALNLPTGYDLVYIDPPYISRNMSNSDNYLKKYHFLEGMINYDIWEGLISDKLKIKQANLYYNNNWENKATFKDLLYSFIKKHNSSIVVLSYVDNATPSIDELKSYFTSQFSEIMVSNYQLSHALSKTRRDEYLFIGVP